jgi:protein gp37
MYREQERYGNDGSVIRQTKGARRDLPIRKKRDGSWKVPSGSFVFVCSWSDFFHPEADEWRNDALDIMETRTDLIFLLLTKRPELAELWIQELACLGSDWWQGVDHIWLGVTAENQQRADERIPQLLSIDWPGKKFVSIEPQLGPVSLTSDMGSWIDPNIGCQPGLDWVICGGESGPNHRECKEEWARGIKDQCVAAGVPFFFKGRIGNRHDSANCVLDGREWKDRPHGAEEGSDQ